MKFRRFALLRPSLFTELIIFDLPNGMLADSVAYKKYEWAASKPIWFPLGKLEEFPK